MMKLSEAKKKYRNQWIAFKFSDQEKEIGKVICRDKNRNDFYRKLRSRRKRLTGEYLLYTGKSSLPKDWGILLCMK